MSSLDICDNEEDHFVIPMHEKATGDIYNVECLCDLGLFYTGYKPGYEILFKDQWEIVRDDQPTPNQHEKTWLVAMTAICATLVLGIMAGIILDTLAH